MGKVSPFTLFAKDLGAADQTGLVIRTHAHFDTAVRHYVESVVAAPEHLPKLPYDGVLRLACALGFDTNHLAALRALGDLRNHFGHRHDAMLTEENVGKLLKAFGPECRPLVITSYEELNAGRKVPGPGTFQGLPPYNKFVIVAVCLRVVVEEEFEKIGQKVPDDI
jgi:hypothetical protein